MNPLLLLTAILPGISICLLIYFLDKHEKEGYLPLLITFVLGMLSALIAVWIQMKASETGIDQSNRLGLLLVYVFIVVAFSEELVKLGMLFAFPYRQSFFNEPLDGIVYAVMVGMGFATVENVIYAYQFGIETILIRAFTAVPAHAIFGIIMGYFVGLSKFNSVKKWSLIATGFVIAVGIHGLYDFFILQQYYEWLMLFGFVTLAIGGFLAWRLIKRHQESSPFKPSMEKESPPIIAANEESEDISTD